MDKSQGYKDAVVLTIQVYKIFKQVYYLEEPEDLALQIRLRLFKFAKISEALYGFAYHKDHQSQEACRLKFYPKIGLVVLRNSGGEL